MALFHLESFQKGLTIIAIMAALLVLSLIFENLDRWFYRRW